MTIFSPKQTSKCSTIVAGTTLILCTTVGLSSPEQQDLAKHDAPSISNPDISTPQIVNGTEPAPNDWRFDAVAAFGKTDNLNGVNADHNTFCNGTLIDPSTVILADHCMGNYSASNPPPAGLYTFRFRRNPDGSLGEKALGWQSFHQVTVDSFTFPDTANDIAIAHLSEPVMHIDPICIGDASTLVADDKIIISGWGRVGPGFNEGDRGWLNLAHTKVSSVTSTHVLFPSAWSPSNPCACGPNMWDSGGGIFVEVPPRNQFELPSLELVAVTITTTAGTIPDLHQLVDPNTCYCPADINGDGLLNFTDTSAFLALFGAQDPRADWNGDGIFDIVDVNGFLADYNAGCP